MADQPDIDTALADTSSAAGRRAAVVPVRNIVLFPGTVVPITMARPRSIAAAQQAVREQRQIGIVLQREAEDDDPSAGRPLSHRHGRQHRALRHRAGGRPSSDLPGRQQRFRISEFVDGHPFLLARGELHRRAEARGTEVEARFSLLQEQVREVLDLLPQVPPRAAPTRRGDRARPAMLADLAATYLDVTPAEKQDILETIDLCRGSTRCSQLLAHRLERAAPVARDRQEDPGLARHAPARGAAARADGGHPAASWARTRAPTSEVGRSREGDRRGQDAAGGRGSGEEGAAPAAAHARGGGRVRHDPRLSRHADRAAVGAARAEGHRHRRGAPRARRRPFRPGEDQAAHRRVPRRAQAGARGQGARSCASSARPASARPRSASRSPAPWAASSRASAWAACTTRPRSAATGGPISARCRATSSRRSARPARATA